MDPSQEHTSHENSRPSIEETNSGHCASTPARGGDPLFVSGAYVHQQVVFLVSTMGAVGTLVWLLASVEEHMAIQLPSPTAPMECFPTLGAENNVTSTPIIPLQNGTVSVPRS